MNKQLLYSNIYKEVAIVSPTMLYSLYTVDFFVALYKLDLDKP